MTKLYANRNFREKAIGVDGRFLPEEIGVVDILQLLEGAAYMGFIGGAIFAVLELRGISRDRETQIMLNILEHATSSEFNPLWRTIIDTPFATANEAEEKCSRSALDRVACYHDGIGYLIQEGMVDAETVFGFLSFEEIWDHMKPWCLEDRRLRGPRVWENFERVAELSRAYGAEMNRAGPRTFCPHRVD